MASKLSEISHWSRNGFLTSSWGSWTNEWNWRGGAWTPLLNGTKFWCVRYFLERVHSLFQRVLGLRKVTVLGGGRNTSWWLRADHHERSLQCGGSQAPWPVERVPPWALVPRSKQMNTGKGLPKRTFPPSVFFVLFQKCQNLNQVRPAETCGRTAKSKERSAQRGLLGWRRRKVSSRKIPQTSPGWSFLLLIPVFKLMDFKLLHSINF